MDTKAVQIRFDLDWLHVLAILFVFHKGAPLAVLFEVIRAAPRLWAAPNGGTQ